MSRRHRLFSQASARFERGVDYELPLRASAKAAAMLAELGEGTAVEAYTLASEPVTPTRIVMPADHPDRVAGENYGVQTVVSRLREVGCAVERVEVPAGGLNGGRAEGAADGPDGKRAADLLTVTPPSWRPDLTDPNDLAEEVIRLEGYEKIGIAMPRALAGKGRTAAQRLRMAVANALAGAGYIEVISSPFGSSADFDQMQLDRGDSRRRAISLANPISDEEPLMRTSLLPGLFRVAARNAGRGFADLALYEMGNVARAKASNGSSRTAPILAVDRRPAPAELAQLDDALPDQPAQVAVLLSGMREAAGWWGPGRPASFRDAIEAAHTILRTTRVPYEVRAGQCEPWHPGRCAEILIRPAGPAADTGAEADGGLISVGYAGELHPRVIGAFRLAPRTCAIELDMSEIVRAAAELPPVQAPVISGYPPATQDVALVVSEAVPAAEVEAALIAGASAADESESLLEDVRLFDVYTGEQVGPGRKSLAYTLRFRAPDRTLTDEEVAVARDAAVAAAGQRAGAVLRGAPAGAPAGE
jgi:phenylalanyl-tRNA synthetase beta chain